VYHLIDEPEEADMARPFIQTYLTPKGERRYRAWWYDAAGKKVGKVFRTKREAEAFLREKEREAATGTLADTAAGRRTFKEVWDEREAHEQFAANTRSGHDIVWRLVGPALGNRAVGDIRATHVDAALESIEALSMRDKARRTVAAVFQYAIDNRYGVTVNPAKVARKSRTRAAKMAARKESELSAKDARRLTTDELRALLGAVPERNRMMVEIMARVGLRPGECYALKVEKFDPKARTLVVDETTSEERFTKTGEPRTIVLPAIIAEHLADHIARFAANGLAFPTGDGTEYTTSGFRTNFQRAAEKVGVNHGYSPVDLRHTAAAFAIAHGANVYDVQNMLGHADASITLKVYGFLWDTSAEKLAAALDTAIREEE
jgi:integrase